MSHPRSARRTLQVEALESRQLLSRLLVTTTADAGAGSLRQAILDANAIPGRDVIRFEIPGPGLHTIRPLTELPTLTDTTLIDGYTQPGSRPNTARRGTNAVLQIELDGSLAASDPETDDDYSVHGLTIVGDGCIVRGLVINRFIDGGISIQSADFDFEADRPIGGASAVIQGNFIGTDATGRQAFHDDVEFEEWYYSSSGIDCDGARATIGGASPSARNLISGNNGGGIHLGATAFHALVLGNLIGTNASGSAALGNWGNGISLYGGTVSDRMGTRVGGRAGAANVISANLGDGVYVTNGEFNTVLNSTDFVITGNFIGTDASGRRPLGNAGHGVVLSTVAPNFDYQDPITTGDGVSDVICRNVISANGGDGVQLYGASDRVSSNWIGTDPSGRVYLGNAGAGVRVVDILMDGFLKVVGNQIGGPGSADGNIVAYNESGGIADAGTRTRISSNRVFGNRPFNFLRGPEANPPEVEPA